MPGRDGSHERTVVIPKQVQSIEITEAFKMPAGQEAVLNAIAQYPGGITTEHIAILTGYKGTSRRTYLQKLTQQGLATRSGDSYEATPEGIAALGDRFEKLPTGRALLEHWLTKLPEGEKRVLQAIVDGAQTKEAILEATNYKPTSVRTYVQKLGARKVITNEAGTITVPSHLYE